jgi:hypothetical protein
MATNLRSYRPRVNTPAAIFSVGSGESLPEILLEIISLLDADTQP